MSGNQHGTWSVRASKGTISLPWGVEAQFWRVSYNTGKSVTSHSLSSVCPCECVTWTQGQSPEEDLLYFLRGIQLSVCWEQNRINAASTFPLLESVSCYHDNSLHKCVAKHKIKIIIIMECLYLIKLKINPQKFKVNNNPLSKRIKISLE